VRPVRGSRLDPVRRIAGLIVFVAAIAAACGTAPSFTLLPAPSTAVSPSGSVVPAASASVAPSASPVASGSPAPPASPGANVAGWSYVKSVPCPDESKFTCVTLSVPRDHAAPTGPKWDLVYAVRKASGVKLGTFVTITGGPGTSGLASADSYTDAFDPSIPEHYDIVFLDQRGVGQSHKVDCPEATSVYYADTADAADPAQRAAVGQAAATYVKDCLTEAKADVADLPFYATTNAIEDLEAFLQYLGADKVDLYGESYGTQYVQIYAAAHPERIKALFIDGPVDLVPNGIDYYIEGARAFEDVLVSTAATCQTSAACRADTAGGDALKAYDALAEKLAAGPITFHFPTAKGTFVDRQLTSTDLVNAASGYAYSPLDRAQFLRDLTAASQGSYVPLARAAYDSIAMNPETLQADPDPTYSDAMYYSTECQDYGFYLGAGDTDARLKAWLDAGEKAGINRLRLGATFYGDLPCIYWPTLPKTDPRPKAIVDPAYPTFILTATQDPATPIQNAMRLFGRLKDSYLFEALGGAHVIFGRGDACPDKPITDYLVSGILPATRVTPCPNVVADEYVPNARPRANQYRDALALMSSMETQISATDDYNYRVDADPITMGCYLGGTLTYTPVANGTKLAVAGCAFTAGAPMTGLGLIDTDAGTFRLAITLGSGSSLTYFDDANGLTSVKGTYRGRPVNLRR